MKDKVVVITGASGGIGAATAEEVARRGASVVLVARREDALRAVAAKCGAHAHAIVADVTSRDEVQRVVTESIAKFGRIDVWMNNVGQGITRQPTELTDDDIDEAMRVNVKSALYGMQEVLPHFKSRNDGPGHQHLVDARTHSIRDHPLGVQRNEALSQRAHGEFPHRSSGDASGNSVLDRFAGSRAHGFRTQRAARRTRLAQLSGCRRAPKRSRW